jgi:hypothetical protein
MAMITVGRIEHEPDSVLLYEEPETRWHFHVIATKEQAALVRPGDRIEYEPYGVNFGWFKSLVSRREHLAQP